MVRVQSVSEVIQDTNSKNFKVITLESPGYREVADPITGEIVYALAAPKVTKKCVWEASYLDDTKHYLYDSKPGQAVYGTIVTAQTDEYTITGSDGVERTVSTYTGFVEGTEADANFQSLITSMLKNAGRESAENAIPKQEIAKEHIEAKQAGEQLDMVNEIEELAKVSAEETAPADLEDQF